MCNNKIPVEIHGYNIYRHILRDSKPPSNSTKILQVRREKLENFQKSIQNLLVKKACFPIQKSWFKNVRQEIFLLYGHFGSNLNGEYLPFKMLSNFTIGKTRFNTQTNCP